MQLPEPMRGLACSVAVVLLFIAPATNAEESLETSLSGVWTIREHHNDDSLLCAEYSWGPGITIRNGSINIDLLAEEPWLELGYLGGVFPIRSVDPVDEGVFRIRFWFSRGQFEVVWRAHFVDEDRLYFVQETDNLTIGGIFGPENIHHKIDGPNMEPLVTPAKTE